MDVQLTSDQQAKLTRMATEQGRAAETLVQEAVERFLNVRTLSKSISHIRNPLTLRGGGGAQGQIARCPCNSCASSFPR
jgi:hypothetical protein